MAKFKDPIAVKNQSPKKIKENPLIQLRQPEYEQLDSCYIRAGTNYGVGHRQPTGKMSASDKGPIPFGRIDTPRVDAY